MTALRNRRGNAYLFVIIAVLMMTLLAGVALALTASSRRASMDYIEFAGLYDLAVAGNEQALFDLRDLFASGTTSPAAINIEAMPSWQTIGPGEVERMWQINVPGAAFDGRTTVVYVPSVSPLDVRWRVYTRVNRVGAALFPVSVQAYIVPALDGNSLRMINSTRITH